MEMKNKNVGGGFLGKKHRLCVSSSCPLSNERHLVVIIIPAYICYETIDFRCTGYMTRFKGPFKKPDPKDTTLTHRVI